MARSAGSPWPDDVLTPATEDGLGVVGAGVGGGVAQLDHRLLVGDGRAASITGMNQSTHLGG